MLYGVFIDKISYGKYSCQINSLGTTYPITFNRHIFYSNNIGLYIIQSNYMTIQNSIFI